MQKYRESVTDSFGNAVVGAVITVELAAGGAATIYSDNGFTVLTSLVTNDAGEFAFYAANERYTITITPPPALGLPITSVVDILLEDTAPLFETAKAVIGDAGSEGTGINIGGVTYESTFKVSDIDGANYAQTILHRHSTTLEPLIVGARSNSDTSSHADVIAAQGLFSIFGAGWAGANYKIFGSQSFKVGTGTISNTSAPGKWSLNITPDGSVVPVETHYVDSDGMMHGKVYAARQKNDIINGQFRIAQAGTSFAAPASGVYDLDGWLIGYSSTAVVTMSQAAGSSTGKLARLVTVTTADASIAAGDFHINQTRIEGYNAVKYLNNTFTIAFKARSSVTGVHCVSIYNGTSSYVAEYTIATANTWEDFSITVTGGTPALASTTNSYGLRITWTTLSGSTYQTTPGSWNTGTYHATTNQVNDLATIGNVFGLQDVRIALGTYCPPDDSSYDEDLAYCQEYYKPPTSYHAGTSTSSQDMSWPIVPKMHASPTVTFTDSVGNTNRISTSGGDNIAFNAGTIGANDSMLTVQANTAAPYTWYTFIATLSARL